MTEPILSTDYWKGRLAFSKRSGALHHAIFRTNNTKWNAIEDAHKRILHEIIKPADSVFDVGCGWGRMLSLMPPHAAYFGIDLSPDFIAMARNDYPSKHFVACNLLDMKVEDAPLYPQQYTWAIAASMRPMVTRNLGPEYWNQMQEKMLCVAEKILFLEFDPQDNGAILSGGVERKL